ncbi:hypothetical protein LOK49_LG08G02279 [Camellia lanceoleosa]|uniref:Uncharacterized protein n=1 Tax=Camellia lanceoleosa TaxID=1840588 RepID=A0ACC0GNF9_9ERIC|nr:hypothetical protein LOK49_LG08G02279 [Camellia lanceoleosa]
MEDSEVNENVDCVRDLILFFPSIPESKKEATPVDVDLSIRNNGNIHLVNMVTTVLMGRRLRRLISACCCVVVPLRRWICEVVVLGLSDGGDCDDRRGREDHIHSRNQVFVWKIGEEVRDHGSHCVPPPPPAQIGVGVLMFFVNHLQWVQFGHPQPSIDGATKPPTAMDNVFTRQWKMNQ